MIKLVDLLDEHTVKPRRQFKFEIGDILKGHNNGLSHKVISRVPNCDAIPDADRVTLPSGAVFALEKPVCGTAEYDSGPWYMCHVPTYAGVFWMPEDHLYEPSLEEHIVKPKPTPKFKVDDQLHYHGRGPYRVVAVSVAAPTEADMQPRRVKYMRQELPIKKFSYSYLDPAIQQEPWYLLSVTGLNFLSWMPQRILKKVW